MPSLTAKRVRGWYRIHKWTSLICTVFLLMSCLTGLPLIFHDELDMLLNHEVRPADLPLNAPTASLDSMVVAAKARMPGLRPYALNIDQDEPRVFVVMSPSEKPGHFRTVIFDEHTGRFLQTGQRGKGLVASLLKLHSQLFMGTPGELLMGVMALLFVTSLVSGALVYGPFMRRLDFGTYRKTGPPRVRWFDLHNLIGITVLAWAVVVGLTGFMNALTNPLFNIWSAHVLPPLLAPYHGQPMPAHYVPVDEAVAHAAAVLAGKRVTSVLFPNGVVASPRHYIVWTKGKTPVTSRLFTPALIDAVTGRVTIAKGLPWYLRTLEVSRPLHFGDYGGMPLKIIWALLDLMLIAILLSGVYLWLSRRRKPVEAELDRLVKLEELAPDTQPVGVLTR